MGMHFVSHCFLAECFLPLQSDVPLSSAYDTSSLAALGVSVPRKKRIRRAIYPKNKCVRVFLWQLNNVCKCVVNFNSTVVKLLMNALQC